MAPDVSVLVPCFNEEGRILDCLRALAGWQSARGMGALEIVVVDDGSTDDTRARAAAFDTDTADVRVIASSANAGKGAALRRGMDAARGSRVVFLDADLSVSVDHLDLALACLDEGADVAVGCRNIAGSDVPTPQGVVRRQLGRGYRAFSRLLLGIDVPDVTCGFKGFQRDAGRALFAKTRARGFGFDAELLGLARRAGYRTAAFPVTWHDSDRSSVKLLYDLPRALAELLATRWRLWRGGDGGVAPALPDTAPARTE